ncbi:biotin--[acetyl-CoA-carboxylase] ligase [candidate division KSB1 bacterium]|nr:biotin--[acetyl-CoA-carboxylase] ligase [candidate division KSB1 bacterium]
MTLPSLQETSIRAAVKNLRFGRNFIYRRSVKSTNDLAKTNALKGNPIPLVVTADEQTRGKGRMTRNWYSPRNKCILLTIVFPESPDDFKFGHYNFLVSLVIASAVESTAGLTVSFKWPNDILIGGKKICGTLSELITIEDGKQLIVTGMGLNVNIERNEFPEDIRDKATSLSIETGSIVDREKLFTDVIRTLNTLYSIWENRGIEPLFQQWMQKSSTVGKNVVIRTEKHYIDGLAEGINQDGSLILKDDAGKLHTIYAGDLEYVINE